MTRAIYFSASGSTEEIVRDIAGRFEDKTTFLNITSPLPDSLEMGNPEDLVVIGVPVFAGRVPAPAVENLRKLQGRGQNTLLICVYGNRAVDDALLELYEIVEEQGLQPIAAASIVARHSIFPKVAAQRPDSLDFKLMERLTQLIEQRLKGERRLDKKSLPGKHPFVVPSKVPLYPRTDRKRCIACGKCADECPAGAIPADNPIFTDKEKCITCTRCIAVCTEKARKFGGLLYHIAGWQFTRKNSARSPSEIY